MATVRWHLDELTGETLTLRLYPLTSGSIANGAGGDAMTEAGDGLFSATVAETLTGWHKAYADDADGVAATGWVNMSATSPVVVETVVDVADVLVAIAALGGVIATADSDDPSATGNIACIVGETSKTKSVTCTNSDGTARDLTDWGDLRLVIERPNSHIDVQVVENADITISGDDNNVFTFQPNAAVLAQSNDFNWSLREASTEEEIISGTIAVVYSPIKDPA